MRFIVYNEAGLEAVVLDTENDAFGAVDGRPRYDPALGVNAMSTLAEQFFETYGDDAAEQLPVKPFADMLNDVAAFHVKFGLDAATVATVLPPKLADFRIKFMEEELQEYRDSDAAVRVILDGYDPLSSTLTEEMQGDLADHLNDQLDALVDLAYVVIGCAYLQFGPARFAEAWSRVQVANMAKVRAERQEDSKRGSTYDVVKPEGWEAPNHADLTHDFVIRTEDIE